MKEAPVTPDGKETAIEITIDNSRLNFIDNIEWEKLIELNYVDPIATSPT